MKENEFFRQTDLVQNDTQSMNQFDSSIVKINFNNQNESCFVDNDEQGAQSQGTEDFWA